MTTSAGFVFGLLAYCLAARVILAIDAASVRTTLFAVANVATVGVLFLRHRQHVVEVLAIYALIVGTHYFLLRLAFRHARFWLLAITFPIVVLLVMKGLDPALSSLAYFVGISYVSFRLTHLAVEVRNGVAAAPTMAELFSYAFFPPILLVGPITPYSRYAATVSAHRPVSVPRGHALLRVIVGLTKYVFVATLLNTLTYDGLLKDGRPHDMLDILLAIVAYYLFLYVSFSGFCDMAIGLSALLGIEVCENFDKPFKARNVKEFWNRWHITLSTLMRDLVFTPLSKAIIRRFGPASTPHAIAFSIGVVFVLIGLWHGVGWGFFIFGALHGLAVIANHYYSIGLKALLGARGLAAYNRSEAVRALAVLSTFVYVALTFMFFANPRILHHLTLPTP